MKAIESPDDRSRIINKCCCALSCKKCLLSVCELRGTHLICVSGRVSESVHLVCPCVGVLPKILSVKQEITTESAACKPAQGPKQTVRSSVDQAVLQGFVSRVARKSTLRMQARANANMAVPEFPIKAVLRGYKTTAQKEHYIACVRVRVEAGAAEQFLGQTWQNTIWLLFTCFFELLYCPFFLCCLFMSILARAAPLGACQFPK